jgi:hypothetical protein
MLTIMQRRSATRQFFQVSSTEQLVPSRRPSVPNHLRTATRILVTLALTQGGVAQAQDLILTNQTVTLGGTKTYNTVSLTNSKIIVPVFNGTDKINTGNLQIRANSITIDATSSIVADGAGYQPVLCDNGPGPTASAGGRGGCAVRDSGGGGGHFGGGGRGTKDCFIVAPANSCQFPAEFEEACGTKGPGNSCTDTGGTCYDFNGLPTVAGQAYWHSIYVPEFGAAGGDKGCRDGDGWDCNVGGAGGGRIVLAAVNDTLFNGSLTIDGRVSAAGYRGCGSGNDSGGGGAGGTVVLVGDKVTVSSTAVISAAGALGGDTNAKQAGSTCPSCAQAPGDLRRLRRRRRRRLDLRAVAAGGEPLHVGAVQRPWRGGRDLHDLQGRGRRRRGRAPARRCLHW